MNYTAKNFEWELIGELSARLPNCTQPLENFLALVPEHTERGSQREIVLKDMAKVARNIDNISKTDYKLAGICTPNSEETSVFDAETPENYNLRVQEALHDIKFSTNDFLVFINNNSDLQLTRVFVSIGGSTRVDCIADSIKRSVISNTVSNSQQFRSISFVLEFDYGRAVMFNSLSVFTLTVDGHDVQVTRPKNWPKWTDLFPFYSEAKKIELY